jgi:nitrogen fixation protein NifQ
LNVPAPAAIWLGESERVYARLMARAVGAGNDRSFATMIASQAVGQGALPPWLGLGPAAYRCLLEYHFPGIGIDRIGHLDPGLGRDRPGTFAGLDRVALSGLTNGLFNGLFNGWGGDPRMGEREDLVRLLLMDKAGESPSEVWMAHVVAAGCMGSDHLWQDLGLADRSELNTLMRRNFPSLAARNVKDMRWKRFLYKQLCEAEGIFACRAPSCEVCTDYHVCFGPGH